MDESGDAVAEALFQHVHLEGAHEGAQQEGRYAIVFLAPTGHLVYGIGIGLAHDIGHAVVGQMLEGELEA